MRPLTHVATGVVLAVMAWFVAATVLNTGFLPQTQFGGALYALAVLLIAAGVGWFAIRLLRKRWPWTAPAVPSWARITIGVAYLLTWVLGVPAVQNHETELRIRQWDVRKSAGNSEVHQVPSIHFTAAVPLAPGVILSHTWVGIGTMEGWDRWILHFWYGDVVEIGDFILGIS